MWNATDMSRNL
jgi:hypothetical protein